MSTTHYSPLTTHSQLSRREWLRLATAGVVGWSVSGWLEALASDAAAHPQRRRSCILLWMNGGPSQMDTFDLKPGHVNGGPFQEIQTSVPDIRISEHLPRVAAHMDRMVLVRSMSTREGDHGRATYLLRTGYLPLGQLHHPALGSLVSKELGRDDSELPNFVSIAPFRFANPAAYTSGFLGPQHAPLIVGDGGPGFFGPPDQNNFDQVLKVRGLAMPSGVTQSRSDARLELLEGLETDFLARQPGAAPLSHHLAYSRAVRMMRSPASRAFNLEDEPESVRDAYGRNLFGQGCLLARRLVERGVPFVEVTLSPPSNRALGWDTHQQNFPIVRQLSELLDPGWAALMDDLKARGLLDSTLIVWMGEFGRTPRINPQQGRDHYPAAWTTVLAGGGIQGGGVVGRTSADGTTVEERPVPVPDFLATVCMALGIDPTKQNMSDIGRPIRVVDRSAQPIQEILA